MHDCHAKVHRPHLGDGSMHILATSTPQTCKLMACWLVWMRRMVLFDTSVDHQLHVKTYTPDSGADGSGSFLSSSYNSATASKASLIGGYLKMVPDNTTVIFTDLDIVPLERYSLLHDFVPPERELTFMYNNIPHEAANTGFMLIRNTPNVRYFMDMWKLLMERELAKVGGDYDKIRPPFDQKMANNLLKSSARAAWPAGPLYHGVFDNSVVTGLPDRVARCTFAYHAIGVNNHSAKMGRINRAMARQSALASIEHPWLRECSAAEQESCDEAHGGRAENATADKPHDAWWRAHHPG